MSKYQKLWEYLLKNDAARLMLSFEEIEHIAGLPLDHSFLQYKKELTAYGWQVQKISLKNKTVLFVKIG